MTFSRRLHAAVSAVALGLLAACGAPEAPEPAAFDVTADRDQDWKDLDADLSRNVALAAIRQHYPEEYRKFVDEMVENYAADIAADPDRTFGSHRLEASQRSSDFIMTLIQRDKVYAVNAPPERLQQWVRSYADVLRTIKTQRGDQLCADYVSKGGEALPEDTAFMARQWNGMTAALIHAMAEGRAKVKERFPASREDFDAMTAWAIKSGVDQTLVADMQAGRRSDPASICDFMIGMNASLAEMPGEEGDRMRLKIMLDILRLQQGEVTIIRGQ